MAEQIDYRELEQSLHQGHADFSASEAQAIACGMLVVNMAADWQVWVNLLVGDIDLENPAQQQAIMLLGELFKQAKYQLQDSNLEFDLLLPDDETSLEARFHAVQDWCRGFLTGVSMSGVKNHADLPDDTRELLADFANIATSGDFDFEEGDDAESEQALEEIIEYVRMGVLLINEELQPIKSSGILH